jgi:glycosyltransferase involved in cell wall biosynthesis/predicted O-methyltransferase YrrM
MTIHHPDPVGGYISFDAWQDYLLSTMVRVDDPVAAELMRNEVLQWLNIYQQTRCVERAVELWNSLGSEPRWLLIESGDSLIQATAFFRSPSFNRSIVAGVIVEDALLAKLGADCFAPLAAVPFSRAGEIVNECLFSLSGITPRLGKGFRVVANDFREKFIACNRFDYLDRLLEDVGERKIILYPLYREIHTVGHLAGEIGRARSGDFVTIALLPNGKMVDHNYDVVITEPFLCLWPLVFSRLDPDVFHVNVGWGIQALPLFPFIGDPNRVIVDFYEILVFVRDSFFEKTHSTGQQVKEAARYLLTRYPHIMHFCSDKITQKLRETYKLSKTNIIGVTEYLREPLYASCEPPGETLKLVYGGCLPTLDSPGDMYFQAFVKMLPRFARDNLRLYLYNSPYLFGLCRQSNLEAIVARYGLADHVHVCTPVSGDEFVKTIKGYDYGLFFMRSKDMGTPEYNYFMANKFIDYLQAGLPIVVDSSTEYTAELVRRYNIGIVLADEDYEHLPEILNAADHAALKENVIRCREAFSIKIGAGKVMAVYDEILRHNRLTEYCARLVKTLGTAENRLYYRDQSVDSMMMLAKMVSKYRPTRIVELGTLSGLSLRMWRAAAPDVPVTAVDLSFQSLVSSRKIMEIDLKGVTLLEQDILTLDFRKLWDPLDRVILYVDAHDLPDVPIMEYVLRNALPALPRGSAVVIDDLWYSPEELNTDNAQNFFTSVVFNEIDNLQCFDGYYAPYFRGGSFMGFKEVIPLMQWVNHNSIDLTFEPGIKSVVFEWRG